MLLPPQTCNLYAVTHHHDMHPPKVIPENRMCLKGYRAQIKPKHEGFRHRVMGTCSSMPLTFRPSLHQFRETT